MRGFILVTLCLVIFSLPLLAQNETVLAHYGTLKIGGILQSTFTYNIFDEDTLETAYTGPQTAFALKRSRLLFWGTIVNDNVKYFIQTEGVSSPYVLDTKLIFDNYIPQTSITIGRFCPNFTPYMPMSAAKLDLVNYPVIVQAYAMWKQIGIQTETTTDYFDFNLGIFNGFSADDPPKPNAWTEDNDAKDVLAAVAVKPAEFIKFIGYFWGGNMILGDTLDLSNNIYGGGLVMDYPLNEDMTIVLKGEYVMGAYDMGNDTTMNSAGFYAHLGFQPNPQFELLGRYDSYDPDTDMDNDAVTWITGGVNYFIDGQHAMISANYIMRSVEEPTVVPARSVDLNNCDDEFVVQFQLFF